MAATYGSDAGAGTGSSPYRTFQRLADSLGPGMTGCLRRGTYVAPTTMRVSKGGRAGAPVRIRSYPGERATLVGRLHIAQGSNHVVVSSLNLNGRNPDGLPSPTVNARYVRFLGNDVTNSNGICFSIGHSAWGRGVGTVIRGNRVHRCGRRPATNFDHGVYVASADNTEVVDNLIYANADRGVQLYPDAQRTRITHNLIAANGTGVLFAGDKGLASSDNIVRRNLITASRLYGIASWYPAGNPVGERNVVRGNCVAGAGREVLSGVRFVRARTASVRPRCPRVSLAARRVGGRIALSGWALGPYATRRAARIQVQTGKGRWRTIRRARVNGRNRFTAGVRTNRVRRTVRGRAWARIRGGVIGSGRSLPVLVRVRP